MGSVVFLAFGSPGDVPAPGPTRLSDLLGAFSSEVAAVREIENFPRTGHVVAVSVHHD